MTSTLRINMWDGVDQPRLLRLAESIIESAVRVNLKWTHNYLARLRFYPLRKLVGPITDHSSDKYETVQKRL